MANEVGDQRKIRRGGGHVPAGEPKGTPDRSRPPDDLLSDSLHDRRQDHHARPEPPPSALLGRRKPEEKKGRGEQKLPRAEILDRLEDRHPCGRGPPDYRLIDQPFPRKHTPRADEKREGEERAGASQARDPPARCRRDQSRFRHEEALAMHAYLPHFSCSSLLMNATRVPTYSTTTHPPTLMGPYSSSSC